MVGVGSIVGTLISQLELDPLSQVNFHQCPHHMKVVVGGLAYTNGASKSQMCGGWVYSL